MSCNNHQVNVILHNTKKSNKRLIKNLEVDINSSDTNRMIENSVTFHSHILCDSHRDLALYLAYDNLKVTYNGFRHFM